MAVIGIDLGTTNSLVAYFKEEGPVIIPNIYGENLTPSVVSIDEEEQVFIGKIAKQRLVTHPEKTISVFKRSMGSKKEYQIGSKTFLPEELSALIIKSLKEDAQNYLGEEIEEAVISVPAYFNDAQRRATKRAGELAGLKVERIINEPTAAAIAYGLHEKKDYTKFLVFDLGGGTFDVSILELYKNVMEVRAVAGDNFLGGEDFTEVLVTMFLAHHNLAPDDLTEKERASLKKSAELAKQSFTKSKEVTMVYLLKEEQLTLQVTLETYEKQCEGLLAKLKRPIVRALSDASLKLKEIDTIVLVGGATKLPIIRSFVSKLFGRLPAGYINPDEVVALGTALQAAMKKRNKLINEIVLTDVCPFTLGTEVSIKRADGFYEPGHFCPIIERNSIIPVSKVERLYTIYDNQKQLLIEVLQGESRKTRENIFLGELTVDVPLGPGGREAIDIRYTYDINGILEVEVTVISTGIKKSMIIEKNPGAMSKEEISKRLEELSYIKLHPREKDEHRYLIARGERIYEESMGDIRRYVAVELQRFEDLLDKQDERVIKEAAENLKIILDEIEIIKEY